MTDTTWTPTRDAALRRLATFAPRTGGDYARLRNFDFGPGRHECVSALSPFIRHRLIAETEVLRAALDHHSPARAEKFVQEVFWRAYFKGWLEGRPEVWVRYRNDLGHSLDNLDRDRGLRARYDLAVSGQTGIDCFDFWAGELVETGWLHNHARMWFASIWIFTLRLPWVLGADFFLRHLVDGDAASNTLSWRWVGGLHTKGKTYLARASNIARYTEGRFNPVGLAPDAPPLMEAELPPPRPAPVALPLALPDRYGLIITEEDGLAESLALPHKPAAVLRLAPVPRGPLATGQCAEDFATGAVTDAMARAADHFGLPGEGATDGSVQSLQEQADRLGLNGFALARPAIGPVSDLLAPAMTALPEAGLTINLILRPYDALTWPHAQKGFFALKKRIPTFLEALDLTDQPRLI